MIRYLPAAVRGGLIGLVPFLLVMLGASAASVLVFAIVLGSRRRWRR